MIFIFLRPLIWGQVSPSFCILFRGDPDLDPVSDLLIVNIIKDIIFLLTAYLKERLHFIRCPERDPHKVIVILGPGKQRSVDLRRVLKESIHIRIHTVEILDITDLPLFNRVDHPVDIIFVIGLPFPDAGPVLIFLLYIIVQRCDQGNDPHSP